MALEQSKKTAVQLASALAVAASCWVSPAAPGLSTSSHDLARSRAVVARNPATHAAATRGGSGFGIATQPALE